MPKKRFIYLSGFSFSWRHFFRFLLPHAVAVCIFLLAAVLYCKPALQGKVLYQEDVLQWKAMAENSFEFNRTHGHFPIWTNGMFSGMPAYQIALDGDSLHVPAQFYELMTLWLRKPVSFFFMAALCFYFLVGVLRINPYTGIVGGLAYAYTTYNCVIIAVGHDTKMQSIALLPALFGAMILLFEKKYWLGMALTALFGGMLVSFGHMQIVYYGVIGLACMFAFYAARWVRERDLRHLRNAVLLSLGAGLVAVLCNAIVLFTTYDSSKETVRGGSELADAQSNYTHNGLSETAAFDFSMYRTEPLVMLVPDIYGGSTDLERPVNSSRALQVIAKMPADVRQLIGEDGPQFYWGGVGTLFSGPPYVGAVICLLALAGLFLLDGRHKWWILTACALTVFMSWGSYFQSFNSLVLKYLPGYNKFRAPSMIIVIPTFLLVMMATMTLEKIRLRQDAASLWRRYRSGLLLTLGVFGLLGCLYAFFDYEGSGDAQLLHAAADKGAAALTWMRSYTDSLKADRQALFGSSLLRSLAFAAAAALVIGWYIKGRMKPGVLIGLVAVLVIADLLPIDWKYLNYENYNENLEYQQNFAATAADKKILQDKDYFRVFDLRDSVSNALSYGAMTAYFHRSIGGYHAAKLRIYEDLINNQLLKYPNCQPVIDMLNTRYIIKPGWMLAREQDSIRRALEDSIRSAVVHERIRPGHKVEQRARPDTIPAAALSAVLQRKALPGSAVSDERLTGDLEVVPAKAETVMGPASTPPGSLPSGNETAAVPQKDSVVINDGALGPAWFVRGLAYGRNARAVMDGLTTLEPSDTALLFASDSGQVTIPSNPDSNAQIRLLSNDNDIITYLSESETPQFAVMSEIFYDRGWRACIDDFAHETPIIRTNYVLRGVQVPAGRHMVRFVFRPTSFYLGRQVQWMASFILILFLLGAIVVTLHDRDIHLVIAGRRMINSHSEHVPSV